MVLIISANKLRRLLISIFILVGVSGIKAQKLEIKSFHIDEKDMTANTIGTIVMDQNGQKCALIKVQTTQKGFSFEVGSLGIVKTIQKIGEIWVYVPEGVKRISIFHQQLGNIRNYELGQSLQRARVYILNLKTEQTPVIKTQKLIINYSPIDAMVLIDSKPYKGNGYLEAELPIGNHNYIIAAEGFETIEGSFKLTESAPRTITENLIVSAVVDSPDNNNISKRQNDSNDGSSLVPLLGIYCSPTSDFNGLKVIKILDGSYAMRSSGIEAGDIITHFDGRAVNNIEDLKGILEMHRLGDAVKIRYMREGKGDKINIRGSKIILENPSSW